MTDTIHGDVRPFLRTIDAATPEQVVKTAQAAAAHIDAQDAKIKALVEALEISRALTIEATEVGFEYRDYDWPERMFVHNGVITAALAAAKETTT